MQCPRCQHENPTGSHFCLGCGARFSISCGSCGKELPPGSRFCNKCGTPVAPESPSQPRFASPESYTPKHLAEKILTSKAALEGERKQVTVLFADLKGSMELLADRDPEEARKLLDPVLELMMEAVHRYEGTVNQVMGDGIMALFGAPLAHEDHAVRACYAALRMQESIKRYGEGMRRSEGVLPQIRVGLNSGEVVVRSIGSDLRMDYTAVGQTTHLAARMEQMAGAGSILISADTLRLAEGYVQVRAIGPVPVKGLATPVEVYEVAGAGPARSRLQAAAARGLTRFVGRGTELEALRQALEKTRDGHGQVVAVVGEPGVGKSRLFWEFTHSHRTQGWLILESGSVSYGKATAYLPVIDLLKAYFQIEARDDGRKIREKITGKLLTLDEALRPTVTVFLALLDVPVEDPHWEGLDPAQRRQQTLEAIKRLLLRESHVQPLCLVFEDLHWMDTESQAVLDSLAESLPTAPRLLLVNYRPEYQHSWGNKTYYTQLRIDPLPSESASELLRALLGDDPSLQPLKRLLIDRTEGNPFFLEESVRTLIETRGVVGERGAYRLAETLPEIQLPATVHAVLAARIDRLPPEEKTLLQTASVIGKDVSVALLQAIVDVPDETLRRRLGHLQTVEFLYEASLFPEPEYTFKHALTHEVAYGTLLQERRRALHARIVDAIERLNPDRLAEQVDYLAHHAIRGEVWDKAVVYFRQAGLKASGRSAYQEASACFEQALEALTHVPDRRDTREQAIDLRLDLRNALLPLGEIDRIFNALLEAETLAEGLADQHRLGWISCYMADANRQRGHLDHALAAARRALAIAETLEDLALQVLANMYLGAASSLRGDYRHGVEFLRRNVVALEGDLLRERLGTAAPPSILSRAWLVRSLAELGEFTEGTTRGEEAVELADAIDHPYSRATANHALGTVYLCQGDFQAAIAALERSLELCEAWKLLLLFPWVASLLGSAYAHAGRISEALPLLGRAREPTTRLANYARLMSNLGEGYWLAGRSEDGAAAARRALEAARERKERGHEAYALHLLGEIAGHGDFAAGESAGAHFRQALALAEELGMRPLVAHCHLGLGKLHRRTGKRQECHEHLTSATTMYRDMEMRFWLEQAEAELKELG